MIHNFFATIFHKFVHAKSGQPNVIIVVIAVIVILLLAVLAPLFFID